MHHPPKLVAVRCGHLWIFAFADLLEQSIQAQSFLFKRGPENGQLVEDATKAPNIALECVAFATQYFWGHVKGRADLGVRLHGVLRERPAETQVPNLDLPLCGEKNIGRLEVAMDDAHLMHILYGTAYLRKIAPNETFVEPYLLLRRLAQLPLEVAGLRPLKNDDQVVLIDEGVEVFDNVWGGPVAATA